MKKVLSIALIISIAIVFTFSLCSCSNTNDNEQPIEPEIKLATTYFFSTTVGFFSVNEAPTWIYFDENNIAYLCVDSPVVGTATINDGNEDDVFIPTYETSIYKVSYQYDSTKSEIVITPKQPIPIVKAKDGAHRSSYTTGKGDLLTFKFNYYYTPEDIEITYFRTTTLACQTGSYPDEKLVKWLSYTNENQHRCSGTKGSLTQDLQYFLDKYPVIDA